MTDRLESMRLLLLVVEMGSLSAAAKKLRAPLPTVSRKISGLEREIGAHLLVRGQRRISLTEAGKGYVESIRPLLEQLELAEQAAAGEFTLPQGELSVTAPALFGRRHVAPLFTRFLSEHSSVRGRLLLTDRHVRLRDEGIDVAVRLGKVDDPLLMAVAIGNVQRVVCASPAYLAEHGRPTRPEDLSELDAVLFDGEPSASGWEFRRGTKSVCVQPRVRVNVNDTEAAVQAALDGLGFVRVLSYQVEDLLAQGKLSIVLSDFSPPPIPVRVVYANRQPLPRRIRAFVDWVQPLLRQRLKSNGT